MRVTVAFDDGTPSVVLPGKPESFPWRGFGLASTNDGNLDGWWTPPAPRATSEDRPGLDGSFAPARLLVKSRVVSLVFHHRAESRAEGIETHARIASWVRKWVRIIVEDDDKRVYNTAGFVSSEQTLKRINEITSTYGVVVTCPDPLKYVGRGESLDDWETATGRFSSGVGGGFLFPAFGQELRTDVSSTLAATARFTESDISNSVSVVNSGQAATWPILEATGPFAWCEWRMGEHAVRWESPVASGQTLRINTHTGEILVGGSVGSAASLAIDDYFQIEPGENTVSFTSSGDAVYRVRWLSAWM